VVRTVSGSCITTTWPSTVVCTSVSITPPPASKPIWNPSMVFSGPMPEPPRCAKLIGQFFGVATRGSALKSRSRLGRRRSQGLQQLRRYLHQVAGCHSGLGKSTQQRLEVEVLRDVKLPDVVGHPGILALPDDRVTRAQLPLCLTVKSTTAHNFPTAAIVKRPECVLLEHPPFLSGKPPRLWSRARRAVGSLGLCRPEPR